MGDSAAIVERGVQHRAPFGRDGSRYRSKLTGLLHFDVRPVIERSWRCYLRMVEDGMRTTDLAPTRLPDLLRATQHLLDRKSTRLNSSHYCHSRMPSSA